MQKELTLQEFYAADPRRPTPVRWDTAACGGSSRRFPTIGVAGSRTPASCMPWSSPSQTSARTRLRFSGSSGADRKSRPALPAGPSAAAGSARCCGPEIGSAGSVRWSRKRSSPTPAPEPTRSPRRQAGSGEVRDAAQDRPDTIWLGHHRRAGLRARRAHPARRQGREAQEEAVQGRPWHLAHHLGGRARHVCHKGAELLLIHRCGAGRHGHAVGGGGRLLQAPPLSGAAAARSQVRDRAGQRARDAVDCLEL
jgi:hypothetical protein